MLLLLSFLADFTREPLCKLLINWAYNLKPSMALDKWVCLKCNNILDIHLSFKTFYSTFSSFYNYTPIKFKLSIVVDIPAQIDIAAEFDLKENKLNLKETLWFTFLRPNLFCHEKRYYIFKEDIKLHFIVPYRYPTTATSSRPIM